MNIEPIGERVVLQRKKEERTKGGIYIPESAGEKKRGIVHAIGTSDGKPLPLTKGDVVLYGGYSNEEIELDDETYVVVEYKDIIARLTE